MSTLTTTEAKAQALNAHTLNQFEAEAFTKLSYKTLQAYAQKGEPVGRIKVGRRVLFIKSMLEKWLASKLPSPATN